MLMCVYGVCVWYMVDSVGCVGNIYGVGGMGSVYGICGWRDLCWMHTYASVML